MGRIRSVKPDLFSDDRIARLSVNARYLFIGLFTEADDEGRLYASSKRIAGALFPHDDRIGAAQVKRWVGELVNLGMVQRYEFDGTEYLFVRNFLDHQKISHPTPSKLPPPPEYLPNLSGSSPEVLSPDREQGKEQGTGNRDIAPRRRDELFEALATACDIDWHDLTQSARGSLNNALKEIRATGATPQDVQERAARWPYDVPLTPNGLAKHWPALGNVVPKASAKTRRLLAIGDRLDAEEIT